MDKMYAGEIGALVGLKYTTTGDTLCDESHPVILENIDFPEPVISIAIEPKTKLIKKNGYCSEKIGRRRSNFSG